MPLLLRKGLQRPLQGGQTRGICRRMLRVPGSPHVHGECFRTKSGNSWDIEKGLLWVDSSPQVGPTCRGTSLRLDLEIGPAMQWDLPPRESVLPVASREASSEKMTLPSLSVSFSFWKSFQKNSTKTYLSKSKSFSLIGFVWSSFWLYRRRYRRGRWRAAACRARRARCTELTPTGRGAAPNLSATPPPPRTGRRPAAPSTRSAHSFCCCPLFIFFTIVSWGPSVNSVRCCRSPGWVHRRQATFQFARKACSTATLNHGPILTLQHQSPQFFISWHQRSHCGTPGSKLCVKWKRLFHWVLWIFLLIYLTDTNGSHKTPEQRFLSKPQISPKHPEGTERVRFPTLAL